MRRQSCVCLIAFSLDLQLYLLIGDLWNLGLLKKFKGSNVLSIVTHNCLRRASSG